mgnify:CR=1 FL=1
MNEAEVWRGAGACMAGDECPQGASEDFQRGYGMVYAAGECGMDPTEVINKYLESEK